jgi:hypothetical protein
MTALAPGARLRDNGAILERAHGAAATWQQS